MFFSFWWSNPGFGTVSGSAIRKNAGSGSALNQCGSTILKVAKPNECYFSASALLLDALFIICVWCRFYKLCPKWISEVKKNPQATTEFQRFSQSAWVQSVRYQPLIASVPFFALVDGAILFYVLFLVHDLHTVHQTWRYSDRREAWT